MTCKPGALVLPLLLLACGDSEESLQEQFDQSLTVYLASCEDYGMAAQACDGADAATVDCDEVATGQLPDRFADDPEDTVRIVRCTSMQFDVQAACLRSDCQGDCVQEGADAFSACLASTRPEEG